MAAITDPNDPRLKDPAYESDPDVIEYRNKAVTEGYSSSSLTDKSNKDDYTATFGGTGGPTGGPLPSPFTSNFTAPGMVNLGGPAGIPYIPQTPQFNAPAYRQAPAFQGPAPFQAPSMQDVLSDPGYQFPLTQGLGAYSNNRAAQGLWGTGATGKGLQDYSQNYANQFYGNIYNRDLNTYQTNFKNAIDSYTTNYGTQYADPNAYNYKAAQDAFAPQILGYQTQAAAGQHQSDLDYSHAYQHWLDEFDQKYKTGSFLRDTAAS